MANESERSDTEATKGITHFDVIVNCYRLIVTHSNSHRRAHQPSGYIPLFEFQYKFFLDFLYPI